MTTGCDMITHVYGYFARNKNSKNWYSESGNITGELIDDIPDTAINKIIPTFFSKESDIMAYKISTTTMLELEFVPVKIQIGE